MLTNGMMVYFLVNGYILQGKVIDRAGDEQHFTFSIEGYGGCGGNHVLDGSQLHRTVFLSKDEAAQYQDQEQRYLEGYC